VKAYFAPTMTIRDRLFEWGSRTYVMAIVNVSQESFSGDGVRSVDEAVAQAKRFAVEGADIIDVGGQSTRPGFDELSVEAEIDRVAPAIMAISQAVDLPVSIDAYRAQVVAAGLEAGAHAVNDIWGFRHDPALADLVAEAGAPAVVMHNQRGRKYHDVIGDIRNGIQESFRIAEAAGALRSNLIADPGFGFGWTPEHSLEMLRRLAELKDLELPLLVGSSRKSAIGSVLGVPEDQRIFGTAATVAVAVANGADMVRVHDVAAMIQVCRMTDAIVRQGY
jgi:dihydropteroate synthase